MFGSTKPDIIFMGHLFEACYCLILTGNIMSLTFPFTAIISPHDKSSFHWLTLALLFYVHNDLRVSSHEYLSFMGMSSHKRGACMLMWAGCVLFSHHDKTIGLELYKGTIIIDVTAETCSEKLVSEACHSVIWIFQ